MSTKKNKVAKGKGVTVGVCVPARDEVHTGFAFDFAKMVGHDVKFRCGDTGNGLKLYTMAGTLIFDQREGLVKEQICPLLNLQYWLMLHLTLYTFVHQILHTLK